MPLSRYEINVATGDRVQIPQSAYVNGVGRVIVIDSTETPPAGFIFVDPADLPSLPVYVEDYATYNEALAALNTVYQADVAKLNNAFALTMLADGPTESAKMAAIRAQYEARKSTHAANVAALKTKYGV